MKIRRLVFVLVLIAYLVGGPYLLFNINSKAIVSDKQVDFSTAVLMTIGEMIAIPFLLVMVLAVIWIPIALAFWIFNYDLDSPRDLMESFFDWITD